MHPRPEPSPDVQDRVYPDPWEKVLDYRRVRRPVCARSRWRDDPRTVLRGHRVGVETATCHEEAGKPDTVSRPRPLIYSELVGRRMGISEFLEGQNLTHRQMGPS